MEKQWTKGDAFLLMNIPNNSYGNEIKTHKSLGGRTTFYVESIQK